MMDALVAELSAGLPDAREASQISVRLLVALIVGAIIGAQRELHHKPAGLRTHILVSLGTTLFVLGSVGAGVEASSDAMSRVIQGIATGIGFLGAGAILKLHADREILGLTTAAGIWLTAAASVAAGLGRHAMALTSAVLAWLVLAGLTRLEQRLAEH
jgi:putative Mg2+ transporter-C (MgtC) family protein